MMLSGHSHAKFVRTYELWQGGHNPVIGHKEIIAVAELALGLKGLILGLELGDADHFGHAGYLLLLHSQLCCLVALTYTCIQAFAQSDKASKQLQKCFAQMLKVDCNLLCFVRTPMGSMKPQFTPNAQVFRGKDG